MEEIFTNVFIEGDKLYTKNLIRGERVYGEKLVDFKGKELRELNADIKTCSRHNERV